MGERTARGHDLLAGHRLQVLVLVHRLSDGHTAVIEAKVEVNAGAGVVHLGDAGRYEIMRKSSLCTQKMKTIG